MTKHELVAALLELPDDCEIFYRVKPQSNDESALMREMMSDYWDESLGGISGVEIHDNSADGVPSFAVLVTRFDFVDPATKLTQ